MGNFVDLAPDLVAANVVEKAQDMVVKTSSSTLLTLARQRSECLGRVHKFAESQLALIDQGDMGRLLSLLAEKNREMEQLQEIETQLKPFRNVAAEQHEWASDDDRSQCQTLLSKSDLLLKEIITLEQTSESRLKAQRSNISQQLQSLRGATDASAAYGKHSIPSQPRLDLSSDG